jgi:hypothetical protein
MVAGKLAIPELLPEGGAVPIALDAGMDVTAEARVFTTDTLRGYLG